jgi:hypothetical protein
VKKLLLVTALSACTILSATSAFAQEALTSTNSQEINFVSPESSSEGYPERSHQRSKRFFIYTPTIVKNVVGPWSERTKDQLRSSNFSYPGGTMNVTDEKQASFGGSVSSSVLSAALNFQVAEKFSVSDSQQIKVPKGKRARVIAYRIDNVWRYDLYQEIIPAKTTLREAVEEFKGTHWARKPIGVWFDVKIY